MTDQDDSPPRNLRPRRPARHTDSLYLDADTTNSSPLGMAARDLTTAHSSGGIERPAQTPSAHNHAEMRLSGAHHTQKHRSSSGFLLAGSLSGRHGQVRPPNAQTQPPSDKRHQKPIEQHTHLDAQHGQQESQPRASSSSIPRPTSNAGYGPIPATHPEQSSTSTTVATRDSFAGDTAVGSSPRTSVAQLDMESAQIVNMALNLSESRRLASRRNISQPAPPRLAPLPDGAPGGSLRYHLQQQRKASRTVSPKPDRSPRVGPGRLLTPLQSAFDPGGIYRYHFSQSTLARAQKAKEYLELMAQYRRVLDLLAPLETEHATRPWTASPPGTPNGSAVVSRVSTGESETIIGRAYNPLQYIRNRKVRARERKAIDGEAQGFNEIPRVSEWIDEVAKWVATGQARIPGNTALPPFAGAHDAVPQASPPASNTRSAAAAAKPKRPRVDWAINPADMIADVYWLELDDNKKLVEDRHWRRVFPQGPDHLRPLSRDEAPRLTTPGSTKDQSGTYTPPEKHTPEPPPPKNEQEYALRARDRAQQKLRALKGSHHRQISSITNNDLLRLHRRSLSESSDTDTDRRRRAKSSVPGGVRSVLELQIEKMIAREQREAESQPLYDHEALRTQFTPITLGRDSSRATLEGGNPNSHHHMGSLAELSESESKVSSLKPLPQPRLSPTKASGRASLEVPGKRYSVDDDTSQPNSPDLRPAREIGLVPAIGMDLSPMSSRRSSPHRNPLTRVKSIFRERSKERSADVRPTDEDGAVSLSSLPEDAWLGSPETAGSGVLSPQRKPSRSPIGERLMGHRSNKSINNGKPRGEEGGVSLRSFFRGPRIDTVFRSGVSRVGDMIWRKDTEEQSCYTSSDGSEFETRGRSSGPRDPRPGRNPSTHNEKGMLGPAPQLVLSTDGQLGQHPPSRPISRRSSRFDLLKPPRIDIENASPNVSPPPAPAGRQQDPVGSDTESQGGQDDVRAAAASLDAALAVQPRPPPSTRHWSIADCSRAPARATLSKREIARLRALLLSSGIHAMEMNRRANQRKLIPTPTPLPFHTSTSTTAPTEPPFALPAIAARTPHPTARNQLLTTPLAQTTLYPLAARTLASSVEASAANLDALASHFTAHTAPALTHRVESLRGKVAGELAALARAAADAADEANHDLAVGQRLKVKTVMDVMGRMLRRRRRRFRWVRRAGWLVVEWLLVGCMWGVRWLLWL
ncbi:hypothetical protein BT67DRAFT_455179 [Trichocladium antarcticum]|uniref:Uncharacterized protein n=1 Tax=Trichocladium antarcticum TaxID=1450529 RepID=A0AAN6UMY2_9PEZI|nr:hypothetical protein BT67DRAFT_455179 [Trichocladium antarcticum]